jgi:hypothetical protein
MESRQVATLLRPHGLVGSSPMPSAPRSLVVGIDGFLVQRGRLRLSNHLRCVPVTDRGGAIFMLSV